MKTQKRLAVALSAATLALSGCYVVPIAPDGTPIWPSPAPIPGAASAPAPSRPPVPVTLHARLYPANDIATETGMISGSVTNMMGGKGRFQLNYKGELLSGEATRVSGDERKGVASAYGMGGSYMSCEYQMNTPHQGAGNCMFSNGARYQVHIGN